MMTETRIEELKELLSNNGWNINEVRGEIVATKKDCTIVASPVERCFRCVAISDSFNEIYNQVKDTRWYQKGHSIAGMIYNNHRVHANEHNNVHLWNHDHSLGEIREAIKKF